MSISWNPCQSALTVLLRTRRKMVTITRVYFEVMHVVVTGQDQNVLSAGHMLNGQTSSYYPANTQAQSNYCHESDPNDMELEMDSKQHAFI